MFYISAAIHVSKERFDRLMRELDRDIASMLDEDLTGTPDHNADKKSGSDEAGRQRSGMSGASSITPLTPSLLEDCSQDAARLMMRRAIRAVSVDSADEGLGPRSMSAAPHPGLNPISASEMCLNSDLDRLSQVGSQRQQAQQQLRQEQKDSDMAQDVVTTVAAANQRKPQILPCLDPEPETLGMPSTELLPTHQTTPESQISPLDFPSTSAEEAVPAMRRRRSVCEKTVEEEGNGQSRDDGQCFSSAATTPKTPADSTPLNTERVNSEKEIQILKFSALQLQAVKALSALASSEKFAELLLVPRSSLSENVEDKQLLETLSAYRDEAMKDSFRKMIKLFVARSVYPSPFKRAVPLTEIERAFSVLQNSIVQHMAEDKLGIKHLEGKFL